jgi:thiol-disulfide isomerase/thioredoxin
MIIMLLLACVGWSVSAQIREGHPAPDLSLPDGNGHQILLSSLKGSVVLIDFWASWCGPCRMNNPHLVKLYSKYHVKGFEILGVSLDENGDAWRAAVGQDGLSWLQVNDNKGWNAASAAAYGVNAIPASFLVDKEGVVRGINMVGWQLESKIKTLVKK